MSQLIVRKKTGERMMDSWAVDTLIDWAVGKNSEDETKEAFKEELNDLAAEFAGPSPTAVELVLAQTAAISWLACRMHEIHYASAVTAEGGMTLTQSEHAQRRIDRAHRRLLTTVRTLATVRRLAIPALQINVARQQVNQLNAGGTP